MISGPFTSWQIEGGKVEVVTDFLFLGSKITGRWVQIVTGGMNSNNNGRNQHSTVIASWHESDDKPRQHIENQRHYSVSYSQSTL